MKRLMIFILMAFVSCAAFAQPDQPASQASIEQLLKITETAKMYEATMQEMTKMIDQSSTRLMERIPPEQQGKFRELMSRLDTILKEEMSWEKMKPQYVQIYMETFNQQEIDDLAAFYQTPSGKSFIRKQPQVIQRTSALSQEKMNVMMERFSRLMRQAMSGQ